MRKFLLALMFLVLMVSVAFASPLDNLKTTWEQSIERATQANRENAAWSPVWSRMQRTSFGTSASSTNLPEGYDPNGEILPFIKIVANNSGGRVRYETMGYSFQGVPIPLAIVGVPKAPKNPSEIGDRIVIRWQCSIHGGENDGAEASLIFLREAAQGKHDERLKDVVLLITPAANPDGKNAQTREIVDPYMGTGAGLSGTGVDPNRVWSKAHAVEAQAALKLYRTWDPHLVIDHHNIGTGGILRHRHIVTFTNGKWANTDAEVDRENTAFAEGLFGQGISKYRVDNSFYTTYLRKFIDDYSPDNIAGNPLYSLSDSLTSSTTNSYSPTRNKDLSLVSMPYMESFGAQQVTRNGETNWEVVGMPNPGSDSVRSSATVPPAKNRFSILMEIVTYHHTWLKVNAMYASVVSAIDICKDRKDDVFNFFKNKDAEYTGLNNSSPAHLTTVYLGAIDYRNSGNSAGGNEAAPFRKIKPLDGYDHGWGPEIFKLDGHFMTAANTVQRWIDYTHYPRVILNNIPQWPIKMGAFYIMDPRATEAATILMRQGIEIYKLKEDVTLPTGSTYKFYGPNFAADWGITKNRTGYIGVFTTKVPRIREEIIDNYSTEANKISLNFTSNLDGVPWAPLTAAQTPTLEDAPEGGGGDWMLALPEHHVVKAGHYVIPTAQKWARYAGFQLEPRSNCGLLFWAHWDSAVGGRSRGDVAIPNFNLDLVKTFDYNAIPASALERVVFTEDENNKPNYTFVPPYQDLNGNFSSLTDAGATVESAILDKKSGKITVTMKDACLHDEMWLTFFFYETRDKYVDILAQVFEGETPGTYVATFDYNELLEEGLQPGYSYFIHYSNDYGDIFGYGTFTKGVLKYEEIKEPLFGCNAGLFAFALFGIMPFVIKRRK